MFSFSLGTKEYFDDYFYKTIIEQVRDIVLILDTNGVILWTNQAAMDTYGYTATEFQNMHIQELRSPTTFALINSEFQMALRQGILFRTEHKRKNSSYFPVEVSSKYVQLSQDKFVVSIIRDISQTVEFETSLRDQEAKLHKSYQELLATHEELAASEEEMRQQFDELLAQEDRIMKQNSILQTLYDTVRNLLLGQNSNDFLQYIISSVTQLVGTPHGFIYQLEQSGNFFCLTHGTGIFQHELGRKIPYNLGMVGAVYQSAAPVIANDYTIWRNRHEASNHQLLEITAMLQFPLKSKDSVVGSIGLAYCSKADQFGNDELKILDLFADMVSIALNNASLMTAIKTELEEREKAEESLIIFGKKYQAIFDSAHDGIILFDLINKKIIDVNQKACEIIGYSYDEVLSESIQRTVLMELFSGNNLYPRIERAAKGEPQLFDCKITQKSGQIIWLEINLKRTLIGHDDCLLGILRNISDRKEQEQAIYHAAYFDTLTALPNRTSFYEYLAQELRTVSSSSLTSGAVLFVDLDDFKMINDAFGHSYGDSVIIKVGKYLAAEAGKNSLVARVGGDEFSILIPNESCPEKVKTIAGNMIRSLSREYGVANSHTYLSASIGIAFYPLHGTTTEEICMNADLAMYAAKAAGKNTWVVFEPHLQKRVYETMILKQGLREAIEQNGLSLVYQPIIHAQSGKIVSFEALLRWRSPQYGSIPPSRFIPLAEESGMIHKIGRWVIDEACRFARKLFSMGKRDIHIAINLSPRQLIDGDFVALVLDCVDEAGIRPNQLEFEVTENTLIASLEDSTQQLAKLRAFGVELSLDDFGTGYSSLTYLKNLPVTKLKIDKSFIDSIVGDDHQLRFFRSIVDMAHVMRLNVVAEGVETMEQFEIVSQSKCDFVQGYFISHPLLPEDALTLLCNENNSTSLVTC